MIRASAFHHRPALAAFLLVAGTASAQSFHDGDLYLVSASLPKSVNLTQPGVMKIDTASWATSIISTTSAATSGRATYDPFRDRLILSLSGVLTQLAANGTTAPLPYAGVQDALLPAAADDGRIYFQHNATRGFAFLDAAGATQDLLNPGGTSVATAQNTTATFFDRATNSLVVGGFVPVGTLRVERLALNAAGDGVVTRTLVDFSIGGAAIITGFSAGPNGRVFITIDDNTGSTLPRLQTVDLATMTVTPFASTGYFGVGGEVAGAYIPSIDRAVVLDSLSDFLRSYSFGDVGGGSIVASGVSSLGGSGEAAQLVTIVAHHCPSDFDNDGFVTGDDFDAYVTAFQNGDLSSDFDHDGFVTGDDFDAFVVAFENGC